MAFRLAAINGMGGITESSPGVFDTTGMQDAGVMNPVNNFLANPGVNGIAATPTGSMVVTATSPASDELDIAAGSAYVENDAYTVGSSEVKYWEVNNNAVAQVTIPPNSSGNARIDLVCVKVDPLQTPGDDGAANCSYVVVQGTPAGSPVAPAVPAKHTVLAQVAVANGFSTITSGNITDRREYPTLNVGPEAITASNIDWTTSGGIWWEELGRTTAGSNTDTLTVNITSKKYLRIIIFSIMNGTPAAPRLRFNGDSGSNYGRQPVTDGVAGTPNTGQSNINVSDNIGSLDQYITADVINIASRAKLVTYQTTGRGTAGAGNKPVTVTGSGKWEDTSNAITSVNLVNIDGALDFLAGTEIIVLGHD